MELSALHISDALTEQILLQRIPVILLGEEEYLLAFKKIETSLKKCKGIIVMGYSPFRDYLTLEGGEVLSSVKVHFIGVPIGPVLMEEKLLQIVTQLGLN